MNFHLRHINYSLAQSLYQFFDLLFWSREMELIDLYIYNHEGEKHKFR